MKTLQIESPGKAAWKDAPTPEPGPGEALIKVLGVTTCPHWDLHIMDGEPMFPGQDMKYPYHPGQPGHEATGEVVALGPGIRDLKVGDRVVAWRDTGKPRPGFYAQFNTFLEEDVLVVPGSLRVEQIASLELAMCVQVTFDQIAARGSLEGRRVALSGLGPAGLVAVQMARAYGAREVICLDPLDTRRELALSLGATRVEKPDVGLFPVGRKGEQVFDLAIDLTGLPVSIEFLMDRTVELVAIFGVLRQEVRFGFRHLFGPGLTLMGYGNHNRQAAERALQLVLDGKLKLDALVTESMGLDRYAEGVEMLRRKEAIKILYLPW
jgi:threonine dehydrogenase-like Zn-dependent dehydrogenase